MWISIDCKAFVVSFAAYSLLINFILAKWFLVFLRGASLDETRER